MFGRHQQTGRRRRRGYLGLAAALGFGLVVTAPARADLDLDTARAAFAQATALSEADAGALWGVELDGPILFVDPRTRVIVTNAPARGAELEVLGDRLFRGRLPDDVNLGNTVVTWAGRTWTMLIWPLPADATERGTLLMHECFHRVQPGLGFPLNAPALPHLDTRDGRIWMRAELRALMAAVETDDPIVRSGAIDDALAFRRFRFARFSGAARVERDLEMNEGLAEYTGIRLGGGDLETRRRRTVWALRARDGGAALGRTFAYGTGAAYGFLLDAADPEWRAGLRATDQLPNRLRAALARRRAPAGKAEAERRAAAYGLAEIMAEEDDRAARRAARNAADRARFVERPQLHVPMQGNVQYSFVPELVEALAGAGTIYRTIRMTGPWGVLEAPGGALLVEPRRGGRHLRVPAPDDPDARPLAGEGWTLDLDPGWMIRIRRGGFELVEGTASGRVPGVLPGPE